MSDIWVLYLAGTGLLAVGYFVVLGILISRRKNPSRRLQRRSRAASPAPPLPPPPASMSPFVDPPPPTRPIPRAPDRSDRTADLPYHIKRHPMTAAELNFYRVLRYAVDGHTLVFPQMPLGSIFYAKTGSHKRNVTYGNKINLKRVDFLLCDAETLAPLAAIELDDRSHRRPDRMERDRFVNSVFEKTALPLIRVPVRRSYSVSKLAARLRDAGVSCSVNDGPATT